jgi:aminoglycoside phosphotransferase (APT) family kinase protein
VKYVDSGISRDAFVAEVGEDVLVALVPRADAPRGAHERAAHEAYVLTKLGHALATAHDSTDDEPAFRIPAHARAVDVDGRTVLVTEALRGIPLDMRAGRQGSVRPWEVIGRIAAAVHRIDPARILSSIDVATRRDHAVQEARVFEDVARVVAAVPEPISRARAWVQTHLPPPDPAVLLHGDLLGQNILLVPDEAPCLIDWERARAGDPAYDLAIVTRGKRNPFQTNVGLTLLLDEYHRAGGSLISANDVRLYELCMVTGWFLEAIADPSTGGEGPDVHVAHVERLLATAGVDR